MNRVLVIALNERQFNAHLMERFHGSLDAFIRPGRGRIGGVEYIYIASADHIKGMRDFEVERWGQWYARPDLDKIEIELRMRSFDK